MSFFFSIEHIKFLVYNAGWKEMHHLSNNAPLKKWFAFNEHEISGQSRMFAQKAGRVSIAPWNSEWVYCLCVKKI